MSVYLVSYDLGQPETSADYKKLITKLQSYPAWCKPEYSLWLIQTSDSVTSVRDALVELVDSNDKILVIKVGGTNWASFNLGSEVNEWLKNHL